MDDIPAGKRIIKRATGYLYAALYYISDRLVIGASLLGWITVGLLVLGLYLWLRSGSTTWFLVLLAIMLVLRIVYWIAKREGFIVFTSQVDDDIPESTVEAANYQNFELKSSGIFSVLGREEYMYRRPTKMWRVPKGDHALMVQRPTGRYLYQFIEAGYIRTLHPGKLFYGSRVNSALKIEFKTTWGPKAGETEYKWYAPSRGVEPKRLRRTLYLGFDNTADRDAIWQSILREDAV